MTDVGARATYERGREAHGRTAAKWEARERVIATARLGLVGAGLVLLGGIVWARFGLWAWATLAVVVGVFAALVVVHGRATDAKERALAAARFHVRGLARLAHSWADLPLSSERFRAADHPFINDLDVFGRASLMQLVDATETLFGEDRLAALLASQDVGAWPEDVQLRAEAVRDLAPRVAFRESIATAAGVLADDKPDASALLAWAEQGGDPTPALERGVAWGVPLAVIAVLALGPSLGVSSGRLALVVLASIALGLIASLRHGLMLANVSARESAATRWRATLAVLEAEEFRAPLLRRLRERLSGAGRRASDEVAALERIVGFVDARRNEVFRLFVGPVLMWDLHCAAALIKWRRRSGSRLRGWLDTLGEIEALGSLGAFAFEHPDFAWPEPVAEPMIEARALGHPLVEDGRRVGNDVSLPSAGRALVVTGSNMSGKSTLLRALGVNAVLANAGAPVCARSMRVGPLRVATSMRVEDSLSYGVSHFYAELLRLKRVIDLARGGGAAVFFLLDEILHGTNSRERVLGASAVVRDLLEHGALGAVSTHDLGITRLESDLAGRVENVHFEEQVEGNTMTFDYVLRPGVVQSSNALRLMRIIGIDAADDALARSAKSES